MERSRSGRIFRIWALWLALGAVALATLVYATGRSPGGDDPSSPKRLGNIELIATATSFDEFGYSGQNNLLRGNFVGSLFSTDQACQASREIRFFRITGIGSAPDHLVAVSISDNTGSTGNFTSTEWHDPPGNVDRYYAVVLPDEEKGCEGARSETIEV